MMQDTEQKIHPRKLEIVAAAITCFLDRGYHQTGVRDIAKQAGISLGNLYNHFKGKESLLAFIAELESGELAQFISALSDGDDPVATLERFISAYADYAQRPENALLGLEILTEALRNPVIADIFGRNRQGLIDALSNCLETGTRAGAFRPTDNNRANAEIILDLIEGHGLRAMLTPSVQETSTDALRAFILAGVKA